MIVYRNNNLYVELIDLNYLKKIPKNRKILKNRNGRFILFDNDSTMLYYINSKKIINFDTLNNMNFLEIKALLYEYKETLNNLISKLPRDKYLRQCYFEKRKDVYEKIMYLEYVIETLENYLFYYDEYQREVRKLESNYTRKR